MARPRPAASMRGGEWTLHDERTQTVQLLPTSLTTSPFAADMNAPHVATTPVDRTPAWNSLNGTLAMCESVVDRLQHVMHHDAESPAAAQHLAVLLRTATAAAAQCHQNQPEVDSSTLLAEKKSLISLVHELRDLVAKQRVALAAAPSKPTASNELADAQLQGSYINASAQTDNVDENFKFCHSDEENNCDRAETTTTAASTDAAAVSAATTVTALETRCAALLARAETAEQAAEVAERTSRVEHAKIQRLETSLAAAKAEIATAQAKAASLSRVVDTLESIVAKQQGILQARSQHARNSRQLRSSSSSSAVKLSQRIPAHDRRALLDEEDELLLENQGETKDKPHRGVRRTRHEDSAADYHSSWEPGANLHPSEYSEDRSQEDFNEDAARDDPASDAYDRWHDEEPTKRRQEEHGDLEVEEDWDPEGSFEDFDSRRETGGGGMENSFEEGEIEYGLREESEGEDFEEEGFEITTPEERRRI